jgi:N utilization substance protein A
MPGKKKKSKKRPGSKTAARRRKTSAKARSAAKTSVRKRKRSPTGASTPKGLQPRPGEQSGDLQGLSGVARADSESVEELVGEGNAFEADAVSGVEAADDAEGKEVHTHEVPEDDVPEEYLDKDS